jgi:hypothetical protein
MWERRKIGENERKLWRKKKEEENIVLYAKDIGATST